MDQSNRERDVQHIRGRRAQAIAAAAVAALLLVGTSACGGSSDAGSDGGTKTTQSDSAGKDGSDGEAGGSGDEGAASADLPDPCDLVPIEKASEILGGEAAEPDGQTNDVGIASRSCSWQTQESVDNPTLDGAGHILTLNVTSAPETMSMDDFWATSKGAADEETDVEGCDEAFWMGGLLSALKDGVYVTGTAGLASDSPDAKASTTDLVAAACASI